jgi:pseudouridine-5'-phosphate glycosidase
LSGGIGGVHRGFVESFDISQDLFVLSKTPVIVVTAGAKAVLDLKKTTFEAPEFFGIPVVGYRTDEFPSFWSRNSGLALEVVANSPEEVASIWKHHCRSGSGSALVVANPVSEKDQIPYPEISGLIGSAVSKADSLGVVGPDLTPFLLNFLNEKTSGKCLNTNVSLAVNNVALGVAVSGLV